VIVRPQPTADEGDIVVALIEDGEAEGAVKRFRRRDDNIVLESANPAYPPIVTREARIVGVVVGLVRTRIQRRN